MGTRLDLVSYALYVKRYELTDWRSRLPPRQLPLLGSYAYIIVYLCDRGLIDRAATGKAGTALVGVLTMGESPLVTH